MKKVFTLLMAVLFSVALVAQTRQASQMGNVNPLPNHHPVVKVDNSRAPGDTVFYFDGDFFSGNGIDTSVFNYANDDIDGLTVATQLSASYGPTSAFVFFYELLSPNNDTNVYFSATSWFSPVAQADNWFSMGPITIPVAGATMSWGHNMNDGNFRDGYKVKISTTGLVNYADFTNPPIFSVGDNAPATAGDTVNSPDNVFVTQTVDLAAYAGQDIYIAFHHDANDMFILNFDNVLITEGPVSVNEISKDGVSLFQNQPNPAKNFTNLTYSLKKASGVSFEISDITGRVVMSLNEGAKAAGNHILTLDTKTLNAGVYFYTMKAEGVTLSRRMVVSK
jgi:hypothetical protein